MVTGYEDCEVKNNPYHSLYVYFIYANGATFDVECRMCDA